MKSSSTPTWSRPVPTNFSFLPLEWHVLSCFFGRTGSFRQAILNLSDVQNLCRTLSEKPTALGFWEQKIKKKKNYGWNLVLACFHSRVLPSFQRIWVEETPEKPMGHWQKHTKTIECPKFPGYFCLFSSKTPWKFWSKTINFPGIPMGSSHRIHRRSSGRSPGTADRSFCSLGVSFAESAKTRRLHLRPESQTPNDTSNGS